MQTNLVKKLKKLTQKIGLGWIFLIIILITYLALGLSNYEIFRTSLLSFLKILRQVGWVILLVFGFLFLFNLFLSPKQTSRFLGKHSGIKGWLIAVIGGVLSTGPIYFWYPLLSDLKEAGMRNSLIVTFLYNRAIKLPLLPLIITYFGWAFIIILTIYMLVFSIINGLVAEKILGGKK